MPDLADKTTRSILGRSLIAASTFSRAVRLSIARYFRHFGMRVGIDLLPTAIIDPLSTLRDHIHYTKLTSWIGGFDWAWKTIPDSMEVIRAAAGRMWAGGSVAGDWG